LPNSAALWSRRCSADDPCGQRPAGVKVEQGAYSMLKGQTMRKKSSGQVKLRYF
jgi:hypothetical protein